MLGFERVLFVPSGNPPLKTGDLTYAMKRYEMVRLATAGNRTFDVLDIESVKPAKSYTVETLEVLLNSYAGSELYFMLGMDAFLDIPNWWMPEKLVSLVNFAVISRPGRKFEDLLSSPSLDADPGDLKALDEGGGGYKIIGLKSLRAAALVKITHIDISSSDIRRRMLAGQSIKYLLPESVESFIISNKLYMPDA